MSDGEFAETKQEAIYNCEQMCISTWKQNKSGLLDWMRKLPETEEERKKRMQIESDVMKIFSSM